MAKINHEGKNQMTPKTKKKAMTIAVFAVAAGLFALFGPSGWFGGLNGPDGTRPDGTKPDGTRNGGPAMGGVDAADKVLVALGGSVYRDNCAACHGASLEGQPDWRSSNPDGTLKAPPHDETGHTWHHPDRDMFNYTKNGGQALAPPGFKSAMPGFGDTLSDREIWAVLSFIHTSWPPKVVERQRRVNDQSR